MKKEFKLFYKVIGVETLFWVFFFLCLINNIYIFDIWSG